jgi:hypothetical protein
MRRPSGTGQNAFIVHDAAGTDFMHFQISGLPLAPFAPLFALTDAELAERAIVRQVANRTPGFPCRVSLCDAEPGERLLLLNYEHLPVASPYRSSHAIYVRENAVEAKLDRDEIPKLLESRLLSLRGFDSKGMMQRADVIQGQEARPVIESMFTDTSIQYIHVHNAKPGCYAARIDRA